MTLIQNNRLYSSRIQSINETLSEDAFEICTGLVNGGQSALQAFCRVSPPSFANCEIYPERGAGGCPREVVRVLDRRYCGVRRPGR